MPHFKTFVEKGLSKRLLVGLLQVLLTGTWAHHGVGVRVHRAHLLNAVEDLAVRTFILCFLVFPILLSHSSQRALIVQVLRGLVRPNIIRTRHIL